MRHLRATAIVWMYLGSSAFAQCGNDEDCCSFHFTPGCSDPRCCELVCAINPFCCSLAWGELCILEAERHCEVCGGSVGCGSTIAGPCCTPHATPFCSNAACCEAVCKVDPFCCEREWDVGCVEIATLNCPGQSNCNPFSCVGSCGAQAPGGCWCDEACFAYGDCCPLACYEDQCPALAGCAFEVATCLGNCGQIFVGPQCCGCDFNCGENFCGGCCGNVCEACAAFGDSFQFGLPDFCDPEAICPADIDDNGVVDGADLGRLLKAWGRCRPSSPPCVSDFDHSGSVDGQDLGALLLAWGECR